MGGSLNGGVSILGCPPPIAVALAVQLAGLQGAVSDAATRYRDMGGCGGAHGEWGAAGGHWGQWHQ